jgi:YHS domain-containing protein/uncharacterized membrane protein
MNRKSSTLLSLGISIALIAVGIWFLCNHQYNLVYGRSGWMIPYHMMTGGGGMGIVLFLFWVAVLSAIGLVVAGMISNHRFPDRDSRKDHPVKRKERIWIRRYLMNHHAIKQPLTDPVCGMTVDPNTAAAKICHKGVQVYFCAEGCKKAFEANPDKYTVKKRQGFWRRYLDRLTKATGGKAQSCH